MPQRRNMTQRVSALLQETNKSGEILLRENDETLMLAPEYVLSQQINSNRNEMSNSIHPQSYLAFNAHANFNKSEGPLVGVNDD